MDYVERVYKYDRLKLEEYEIIKNQVHDLWDQLESEKMQLQTEKVGLEEQRAQLEADRNVLKAQKTDLDSI
jgi:hypothetical protein